ncbi:MAG: hypothetical protein COX79_01760 [Candidatus Levybacteria bacterium CG_4_10_14_0_2_um_filter_36_16]|nr:MAG: hypothetical protein AUK12_00320 [Candidatus Levybacteria bacterium CG2_30_37_29]PIR79274.1 MAG: hypothetical protein COU26_01965 [Candidatus Levybacteria bacterium CG10_big_fil_rev_8_21_14_0_10_36_30]PIZ97559.1 MAG: hypothetical protein COX79_01760 [Candidatus Levybacteria bacterium CG_4_10_14_0_2_um_filter_36_16]PJA90089.1 MAG: hypothetical protein CO136_03115 [Candidatus Levybacteria bacterium CG_4_9_14_3_um_filter_36_7]
MKTNLDITQCIVGMDKMLYNAHKIKDDGNLLEKAKSPTATFLYAIAIEELSKAYYLGLVAINLIENKTVDWQEFWKTFRDHKFKQTGLIKMMLVGQNLLRENFEDIKKNNPKFLEGRTIEDINNSIKEILKSIKEIEEGETEKLKWRHLYVDYINNKWELPSAKLKKDIFIKENVETYLIDVNTMMKQIIEEAKKKKLIS